MITDSVNKITFEFTCSSENAASNIQREFLNYTMPQLPTVVAHTLAEYRNKNLSQIDRIEIDLGFISIADISTNRMVHEFKAALAKEIHQHHNRRQLAAKHSHSPEWMLIKEFIESGNVPWWVNKNMYLNINKMLQRLIVQQPNFVKNYFTSIKDNPPIKQRVRTEFSSSTLMLIDNLLAKAEVPEVANTTAELVNEAKATIKYFGSESIAHVVKLLMANVVIAALNIALLDVIQLLGALKPKELSVLHEYIIQKNIQHPAVLSIINTLSVLHLEFLQQSIAIEKVTPFMVKKEAKSPVRDKLTKFIWESLSGADSNLLHVLNTYSEQRLTELMELFKKHTGKRYTKENLAIILASHPHFITSNLLQIPVKISASNVSAVVEEKVKAAIPNYSIILNKALKRLTNVEMSIMQQITQQGAYDSNEEKNILIKFLLQLPQFALLSIAKVTLAITDQISTVHIHAGAESGIGHHTLSQMQPAEQKLVIENAGLCLIAPYLPALFQRLNYLEKSILKNSVTKSRALYLLQYLATGKQACPEYVLPLNKLFCGFAVDDTITGYKKRLYNAEKEEAAGLLSSIIANWKALKATTADGLRASFLQRKGLLVERDDYWVLQIEKKSYDVLLDSLPWAFSVIKLPWMNKGIQVEW